MSDRPKTLLTGLHYALSSIFASEDETSEETNDGGTIVEEVNNEPGDS